MAQEIGTAYVTVQPSAKGFGKSVEGEIDQGVGGATKKAGGRLRTLAGNALKWGGAAVAAVGTIITGLAIKGGIDRALNIEDAQAKLKGLGHDAQSVDQIMTDALASVRGTAYGLDSAATTAASAVASGIKPGKELEGYLRLTADAATIAGVSMEEMGSIINKTTAKGRVGMDDLNRLTERGIPILQFLADEYGVTAEEMSKMVSSGEVDSERFRKALEDNVGGAALASGDTVRGSFANMGAALSRLGLTFVQPLVDNAQSLFTELTTILDGLNERLGPFAEKFSEWFGEKIGGSLEGFGERFLGTLDSMSEGISNFSVGDMLSNLVPMLSEGISKAASWLANGGIQILVDGFIEGRSAMVAAAVEIVPALMSGLLELIPALGELAVQIVTAIADLAPALVETLANMAPMLLDAAILLFMALIDALVTLAPTLLETAVAVFLTLVDALVTTLPALITTLLEALPVLIETLLGMIPMLLEAATTVFLSLIDAVLLILPELLTVLLTEVLPSLLTTLIEMIPELLNAAIETFIALVDALVEVLPMLITTLIGEVLPSLVSTLIQMVPTLLKTAVTVFFALVSALVKTIPKLLSGLWDAIVALGGALLSAHGKIQEAAFQLFSKLGEGFANAWRGIWTWIQELPGKIRDIFKNAGTWLVNAGKKVLDGLINGLKSGFNKVKDTLGNLTDKLPSWKGPAERDAQLLTGSGRIIMDSLVDGFKAEEGAVKRYLTGLTGELGMAASVAVSATGTTSASNSLNRSDLDYLADRIARLMGLESERGTSRALSGVSALSSTFGRMA